MMKRVAVALDGTPQAEQALIYARSLAYELVLIRVVRERMVEELEEGSAQEAAHYLHQVATALRERGQPCTVRLASGQTASALLESLQDCELLVICSQGRTGLAGWLKPSVAARVAARASCPVLVVRSGEPGSLESKLTGPQWAPRRALVALDTTSFSEGALPAACSLLTQRPAQLVLLGASGLPPVDSDSPEFSARRVQLARLGQYLQRAGEDARAEDLQVSWRVEDSTASEAILDWAERERAEVVCLATHGRTGAARWLLGSVSEKVLRKSRRPVLLVNPRSLRRPADRAGRE
ncbi:MAG: hypothetical protein AMXMBFR33_38080 [Candidatus Xenobia bacterium]